MGVRLTLSLLLLLAYSSGVWPKNTRSSPIQSVNYRQYHRYHHQLHRQVRALSEFLLPPPVPTNFHIPHPPPPPIPQKNQNLQSPALLSTSTLSVLSPPVQGGHTRNGRYVNSQNGNNNNSPGYFSKLMNWLIPFSGNTHNDNAIGKDSHGQGPLNNLKQHQQIGQYAPHQPYTSGIAQYGSPPQPANSQNGYTNMIAWINGKPCNPCNEVPWMPIFRDSANYNPGQYAPNAGSNSYLATSSVEDIKTTDFSYSKLVGPHSKPFNNPQNSPPEHFDLPSPNLNYQKSPNLNHATSNFNHQSSNLNHPSNSYGQPTPNLDYPSNTYDQQTPYIPYPPFDPHYPQNFNYQSAEIFEHHPSSTEFDHSNSNYPSIISDQPTIIFNEQSSTNFRDQASTNLDHEQHHEPSQVIRIIEEPPSDSESSEISGHQEPDHAESRPVFVNSNTSNIVLNESLGNETEHQFDHSFHYSKTTIIKPSKRKQQHFENGETIHFQRSPLIDLSVAGESSTKIPNSQVLKESNNHLENTLTEQPVTVTPLKGKSINDNRGSSTPSPILIDYILSSPDQAFDSSKVEKETRSSPRLQHQSERTVVPLSTTTSTTQRATAMPLSERQQETLIESIVQSYEFYKQKNETRANEVESGNRILNNTDDFSASKEVTTVNEEKNGKKNKQIIQIIIPYTSQYTPSPFHPTQSIADSKNKSHLSSHNSSVLVPVEEIKIARVVPIDENVEDNIVIQESRRVSVTQNAPDRKLRNNRTDISDSKAGHTIDVHRLQKNIDNWTIQEYSKHASSLMNYLNSTHPRWISSKQIPDEYLQPILESEESEYYDFNNETEFHRGTMKAKETSSVESVTKVNIINATYPKSSSKAERFRKYYDTMSKSTDSERVYVVTPIPNRNSLEDVSSIKNRVFRTRNPKVERENSISVEQAYQVLPQAVNNLAVLSNTPDSAAPALWGIMEHEEIATNVDQPRWRSESDVLPAPPSTPVLYAGHSKVSRAR